MSKRKNLDPWGRAPGTPPLDPPMHRSINVGMTEFLKDFTALDQLVQLMLNCKTLLVEKASVAPDMILGITLIMQARMQAREPFWL